MQPGTVQRRKMLRIRNRGRGMARMWVPMHPGEGEEDRTCSTHTRFDVDTGSVASVTPAADRPPGPVLAFEYPPEH